MIFNKKTIIILSVLSLLLVAIFLSIKLNKKEPHVQEVSTFVKREKQESKQSTPTSKTSIDTTNLSEVNQRLGLSTSESSSSDSLSEVSSPTNIDTVKSTMQSYCAIELDKNKLDNRSKKLKNLFPPDLYEQLKIDNDTKQLKKMLDDWTDKKVIDTNQSTPLLSQSIQSLKVYSNATDTDDFIVIVTLQLKSPSSPNTSQVIRQYSVKTSQNKVSEITNTSEVADKK